MSLTIVEFKICSLIIRSEERTSAHHFLPLRISCSENNKDLLNDLVKMSVLFCVLFSVTVGGEYVFSEKTTPASAWLKWVEVLTFKVGLQGLPLWVHYSWEKILFCKSVEIFIFIHYKIFTMFINKTSIVLGFFSLFPKLWWGFVWLFYTLIEFVEPSESRYS